MNIVVMGVAGSGKTTIGRKLAPALHCALLECDGLHSEVGRWLGLKRESEVKRSDDERGSIEAASPFGWERYVGPEGAIIGVTRFGASALGPVVMREYGFTPEYVVDTVKAVLTRCAEP
jgi:hypothetical protein